MALPKPLTKLRKNSAKNKWWLWGFEHETDKWRLRDRLARDLHDDLASTLGSVSLYASSLRASLRRSRGSVRALAEKIGTLSLEAVETIGDIVWSVSPQRDRLNELLVHIREYAAQVCTVSGIRYTLDITMSEKNPWMEPMVRKNLYLIVKEGLTNVVAHAKAQNVSIGAGLKGTVFQLTIRDDGGGFDPKSTRERGHGLRSMERRAREIGARLKVESSKGHGTLIELSKGIP